MSHSSGGWDVQVLADPVFGKVSAFWFIDGVLQLCLHMMEEARELFYKNTKLTHEGFTLRTKALSKCSTSQYYHIGHSLSLYEFWRGTGKVESVVPIFVFHTLCSKAGTRLRTLEKYYINLHYKSTTQIFPGLQYPAHTSHP